MLAVAKTALRSLGIDSRAFYQSISAKSVDAAVREQGLSDLRQHLRKIVPNILDQYTLSIDVSEYHTYWETKMRSIHAFQIDSTIRALNSIGGTKLTVVDVGDSSGNHGAYLKRLTPQGQIDRIISVNLDPVAVEKVRSKGGEAILCRAEELDSKGLYPNLILLFETLEHLSDPLRFLHTMADLGKIENILLTVPYRRVSRFGGELIRTELSAMPKQLTPEQVHIFELCPEDWKILAQLAGYQTEFCRVYRQYPLYSSLRVMQPLWRKLDFEGFIALFLRLDTSLSERYSGW